MWELYDALIEGIPDACTVEEFVCGTYGVLIRSVEGYGFSPIVPGDTRPQTFMKKALQYAAQGTGPMREVLEFRGGLHRPGPQSTPGITLLKPRPGNGVVIFQQHVRGRQAKTTRSSPTRNAIRNKKGGG